MNIDFSIFNIRFVEFLRLSLQFWIISVIEDFLEREVMQFKKRNYGDHLRRRERVYLKKECKSRERYRVYLTIEKEGC